MSDIDAILATAEAIQGKIGEAQRPQREQEERYSRLSQSWSDAATFQSPDPHPSESFLAEWARRLKSLAVELSAQGLELWLAEQKRAAVAAVDAFDAHDDPRADVHLARLTDAAVVATLLADAVEQDTPEVEAALQALADRGMDQRQIAPHQHLRAMERAWHRYVCPKPASAPPAGTTESKGGKPRISSDEAEILVGDWLRANAKDDPARVTRDAVADATGVSKGGVSNTAAWKAFKRRRDAESKPGARDVQMSDKMLAKIPSGCAGPDDVAALVEEQRKDEAENERRHKRRHKPS